MNAQVQELIKVLTKSAEHYDNQHCEDDRYDEGYADAMYTAIDLVKDMLD